MRHARSRLVWLILACMMLSFRVSGQTSMNLERVTIYFDAAEIAANNGPLLRNVELKWQRDPALPGDYVVHIHKYINDVELYQVVDTITLGESPDNNWGDPVADYHNRQEIYRITLYDNDPDLPGVMYLSEFHGTILLHNLQAASIDPCEGTIALSWDNYIYREVSGTTPLGEELPPFFTHNRIMVQYPGETGWHDTETLDFEQTEYTYTFDRGPGRYRFRIEAIEVDPVHGDILRRSWSNVRSIQYNSAELTSVDLQWVDVVDNSYIQLAGLVGENHPGDAADFTFEVYRSSSRSGTYEMVGTPDFVAAEGMYTFSDGEADVAAGPWFYFYAARKSGCPELAMMSDTMSSLFLAGEIATYNESELIIQLSYEHFPGVANIRLLRMLPGAGVWDDLGPVLFTPDYLDDLSSELASLVGEVRYKLVATYGTADIESNEIAVSVRVGLELFNAFNPGSSIYANRFFRPRLLGQIPSYYHLQIFNRWGQPVFEIVNPDNTWEGWDGRLTDGTEAPAGVYGYRFEYQVGTEPRQEHIGTVFLMR